MRPKVDKLRISRATVNLEEYHSEQAPPEPSKPERIEESEHVAMLVSNPGRQRAHSTPGLVEMNEKEKEFP